MAEWELYQVQEAEMGILRRVHGVPLRDKVRECEKGRTRNVEPILRQGDLSQVGSAVRPEIPRNIGEASPAGYTHGKLPHRSNKDHVVRLHLWPALFPLFPAEL